MTKRHSTHFIFSWSLAGLVFASLFLFFWPDIEHSVSRQGKDTNVMHAVASYADAVEKASASVVSIQAIQKAKKAGPAIFPLLAAPPATRERHESQGSGVIIDQQGHILTNYHVIAKADKILVNLPDGRQAYAKTLGSDPDTDLAVITIELDKLPVVAIANTKDTRVGDIVLAIGNPFGIGQTVTQGIISATGRDRVGLNTYENFIQTDAAINPGNSGGALINSLGEIVGINAAIFSETGSYQGISFAIPIDMSIRVMQEIIKNGQVIRGWLGVEGVDLNAQMLERIGLPNIQGVLITDVFHHSPADKAGLVIGDIISNIDNIQIRDTRDVLDVIARGQPGNNINISGFRQRQSFNTQATLDKRPQQSN